VTKGNVHCSDISVECFSYDSGKKLDLAFLSHILRGFRTDRQFLQPL
jgi:hypothetical protein